MISVGKNTVEIVKSPSRYGGYYAYIRTIDGRKITIQGDTAKEVERDAIAIIKEQFSTTIRKPTYRELSRRNWKGKEYSEKELKRELSKVQIAALGGAFSQHVAAMEEMSHDLLKNAIYASKFNEYTGNLANSYVATVVSNGKVVHQYHLNRPRGKIYHTKRGKRYSYLMSDIHPRSPKDRTLNGKDIRYLKKWETEKEDAYRSKSMLHSKGNFRIGYIQGGSGDGRVRSGIVIENTAPYASAVHRRYRVLANSTPRTVRGKWGGKYEGLVRVATLRTLRKIGIK